MAIIVKRIIWTDCVGEKNNYMGSVFFILTVDTILEKVLGQYTHEHFNSKPIIELIFQFAVTITDGLGS